MGLYLIVNELNVFDMKKFLLVLLSALFLGACSQKTCPTYASNTLDDGNKLELEEQSV
jgi:hypothetical protein